MTDPIKEAGLFASLRRLLATSVEMAQVRLEIFGTEFEFEKRRIFDGLLWGAVALLFLGIGFVLLCGFIILLFWDGYRLAALGVMALLFFTGSVVLMDKARQRLHNKTNIFNATLGELERDKTSLQSSDKHEQR